MDSAGIRNVGLGNASYVEECQCPAGYSGLSCEVRPIHNFHESNHSREMKNWLPYVSFIMSADLLS